MKKVKYIVFSAAVLIIVFGSLFGKSIVNKIMIKDVDTKAYDSYKKSENISLKSGDYVLFGKYLGQPILWKVLDIDENKVLLNTEYIICFKAFDASHESDNSSDISKFGSSEWEKCSLKKWLNSSDKNVKNYKGQVTCNDYSDEKGFLCDENFDSNQSSMIENVFLLSEKENSKYFSQNLRRKTATATALKNNDSPYILTQINKVWYWTRDSVSSNRVSAKTITTSGGYYKSLAYDGATGVSPAMYLKSKNVISHNGNGEKDNPYVIG